ncbi:carboxypeptidase Y-deficient [Myotisia sp. PD_48]|nr:carboxypeptidase Y-deficient [Myotisia sp. PD_48]
MSNRSIGGGRVLGSGRSLVLTPPKPPQSQAFISPSASSVSLNSPSSASQISDSHDLSSKVVLKHARSSISRSAVTAESTNYLACPICNDEMVTLLQLNRHLDDVHRNLEDEQQVEVKDWFQIQVDKAKRFQPLAVLNQKLKGLDVFESNNNPPPAPAMLKTSSEQILLEAPRLTDADDLITKSHWQQRTLYDTCLEPTCEKRLTATTGCINCRKCGRLFCEEHTMYQMKLSRSAQHEPVRGFWSRVCETCYKSREGYNDSNGVERDASQIFKAFRKPILDKSFLEISRLEKRLSRLTQLLSELPPDQVQSRRWSIAWQNDERKIVEQSVVSWQDDATVSRCPFCQQEFSSYTFRRHHCRTCGKVVCGDTATECSSIIGLDVAKSNSRLSEKPSSDKLNLDIRLCKECRTTLFSKRDFAEEVLKEPPDVRCYKNLAQFERGIRLLLPRFQNILKTLQDPENPPSPAQLTEASKVRKRLMDSFAQYDVAARRIRDNPTTLPTQLKLQKAIYLKSTNFLHLHMLPLKTLPKILKHATPHGHHNNSFDSTISDGKRRGEGASGAQPRSLAAIKYGNPDESGSTTSLASNNSSAISALEAEEQVLRDRLIVLEEQKFFVSEMIADANKRRQYDEASSLAQNIIDLNKEIDHVNGMIGQLDFEGLFTTNNNNDGN